MNWFKGNIHTHTTKSDGDEDPIKVAQWYKEHEYDFLVLTDHNHRTILDYDKNTTYSDLPLMIPGEEVTISIQNGDITTPVHINGIGINRLVEPIDATGVVATIQANVDSIKEAGGIASINHPNYKWAYTIQQLVQVNGATSIEIFNGVPDTNVYGSKSKPSCEQIWDGILSAGKLIYGVATDDSHHYHDFSHTMANPGKGWICVQAESLTQSEIINSIKAGTFYSSTGVFIKELDILEQSFNITIREDQSSEFRTTFTGYNGQTLYETDDIKIEYKIPVTEKYVRATIQSSNGSKAWTQPVFNNL